MELKLRGKTTKDINKSENQRFANMQKYISSIFNNFFTEIISNDTSLLNKINLPGPSTSSILSNKKIYDEVRGKVSESKFYEILILIYLY